MDKKNLIIAIDGPAGSGKSTAAKMLAEKLGYIYIDTGAMYRGVAWKAMCQGISPDDEAAVGKLAKETTIEFFLKDNKKMLFIDGTDATDAIREDRISDGASKVSRYPVVREALTEQQRSMGRGGGVVMEGRDVGTVVFPDAQVKFFLDAAPEERAKRRVLELRAKKQEVTEESILEGIKKRDRRDQTRGVAPLKPALDAVRVDTTYLSVDEVIEFMLKLIFVTS